MTVRLLVSMNVGRKSDLGWSSMLISGMRKAREGVAKRRVVDSNMIAVSQNVKSVCDDLVMIVGERCIVVEKTRTKGGTYVLRHLGMR